jgi:hypothetical protein
LDFYFSLFQSTLNHFTEYGCIVNEKDTALTAAHFEPVGPSTIMAREYLRYHPGAVLPPQKDRRAKKKRAIYATGSS